MHIFTMGFAKKSARLFFELVKQNEINLLLDVRLNNKSQLAGFTKYDDIVYFLKEICGCVYAHGVDFAPTKELLDGYRDKKMDWPAYENAYKSLIHHRNTENKFCDNFFTQYAMHKHILLLCSESTADKCHRRLAAEILSGLHPALQVTHL
ncbi:MAG: DUF488 domain-containing protein [Defluviitaleaceae bacterium]|nr:DUF488 domain-containing protein [Defluviitaleaceae bacterium]MCL2239402.1 DUF488 domain-containing protein [Defluviitaleaceae bacterium]